MSHDWSTPDDLGGFDGSFAFDTINDFLPQNGDEYVPDPDDSWLTALIADDRVWPTPNDNFEAPFEADVISDDIETGCDTPVNTIEPTLDVSNLEEFSFDQLGTSLELLDGKFLKESHSVAADQDATQVATNECPCPLDHISLGSSVDDCPKISSPNRPTKRPTTNKKKFKRTKISSETRLMLDAHFNVNPYPTDGELALLSGKSGLAVQVIKRWFMNARSRKQVSHPLSNSSVNPMPLSHDYTDSLPQPVSPPRNLFVNELVDPDRCSPVPSSCSLERYLAAPTDEEAIPTANIEAALQESISRTSPGPYHLDLPSLPTLDNLALFICDVCQAVCQVESFSWGGIPSSCVGCSMERFLREPETQAFHVEADTWTHREQSSVVGSDASADSGNSYGSFNSRISVSSRASRRGRKRWGQPLPMPAPVRRRYSSPNFYQFNNEEPISNSNADAPYFCTSADCDKTFRYRSEWTRHEGAVHHEPYQWICCLDMNIVVRLPHCFVCGEADVLLSHVATCHFRSCSTKSEEERTFLREDQLAQHMKRAHVGKTSPKLSVPKVLLSAWKILNPSLSASSLHCGFCGMIFATWKERQDHVFDHLEHGICKSAWWPDRLPVVPTDFSDHGYTCSACCASFPSIKVASHEHAACASYSCRYLHDWHALFESIRIEPKEWNQCSLCCRLCAFKIQPIPMREGPCQMRLSQLRQHARSHNLQACNQNIYTDKAMFQQHMREWHGAKDSDGINWHVMRFIERKGEDHMVRTWMELQDCLLCDTKPSTAHGVCSVVTPIHRAEGAEKEPRKEPLMWRSIESTD